MSWNAMLMALAVAESEAEQGSDLVTEITVADEKAIRRLVRAQLSALRVGNAEAMYALTSPGIRETFPDADALMALIVDRYAPLADARQLFFGDIVLTPDGIAQVTAIVDRDGRTHHALYLVEQQITGNWAVHGCVMAADDEIEEAA